MLKERELQPSSLQQQQQQQPSSQLHGGATPDLHHATCMSPAPGGGVGPGSGAGCAGCGGRITDRFYLLAVDKQWHSACLKCCECKLPLDSELTCFSRANNIYCKEDYYRLFAVTRCARCQEGISARELVMRARDLVYHVHCFTCAHCQRPLTRGDHFGMRDGLVFCRTHFEELLPHLHLFGGVNPGSPGGLRDSSAVPGLHHSLHPFHQGMECCGDEEELGGGPGDNTGSPAGRALSPGFFNGGSTGSGAGTGGGHKGRPRKRKVPTETADLQNVSGLRMPPVLEMLHPGELAGPLEQLAFDSSSASSPGNPGGGGGGGGGQQRTKRMRTSFKHHQLRTMKSYFAINQNPDAKDLKQLAQKTGLSKRVLQVWFQNARAKWRRNMMRQENHPGAQQQQGQQQPGVPQVEGQGGVGLEGTPLQGLQAGTGGPTGMHLQDEVTSQGQLTFNDLY